jgi:transposase InsO family protein
MALPNALFVLSKHGYGTNLGDDTQLAALLDQFLAEYNHHPHQGLPIPRLSPNEFANRIWLF